MSMTLVTQMLAHIVVAVRVEAMKMTNRPMKLTLTNYAPLPAIANTAAHQDTARLANAPMIAAITPDAAWQAINTEQKTALRPI